MFKFVKNIIAKFNNSEEDKLLEAQEALDNIKLLEDERNNKIINERQLKLQNSFDSIYKLRLLTEKYDNVNLTEVYITLNYIHNIFVENEHYDLDMLFKVNQYYTNNAIDILEKNEINIDKKIKLLKLQQKEINEKLILLKDKLKILDMSILLTNKKEYDTTYTEYLKRFLKTVYNSFINNDDERLGISFKLSSFLSYTNILTYNINSLNNTLYENIMKLLCENRKFLFIKNFHITEDCLKLLNSNFYNLRYICTFILNSKEIEIIKVNKTYILHDVADKKMYISDISQYLDEIINEKNTESYNLTLKIDELTSKIQYIDIELLNRNTINKDIIDVFDKLNTKLQAIDFFNDNENVDLEINTLNTLLNFDIK